MAKKAKFGFLKEDDFLENDSIQEVEAAAPVEEPAVVEEAPKEAEPVVEEKEILPAPEKAEEKRVEKPAEKTTPKKSAYKKKPDKDLKADFLQIDIRGMRDYLSTITSYEAMRTGDKVSFNTYIRSLIEKDMKKNASTYEAFKRLFEDK